MSAKPSVFVILAVTVAVVVWFAGPVWRLLAVVLAASLFWWLAGLAAPRAVGAEIGGLRRELAEAEWARCASGRADLDRLKTLLRQAIDWHATGVSAGVNTAVNALQFQDMTSQLNEHARKRTGGVVEMPMQVASSVRDGDDGQGGASGAREAARARRARDRAGRSGQAEGHGIGRYRAVLRPRAPFHNVNARKEAHG